MEGAEEFVWHGMGRLRDENPKIVIFMEFSADRLRTNAKELLQAMRVEGFTFRTVDYQGDLIPISEEELLYSHEEYMLWLSRE